jgi:hypothetical protein
MRCLSAWFDASSSFFEGPIRRYASERWVSAMGFDDGWVDGCTRRVKIVRWEVWKYGVLEAAICCVQEWGYRYWSC